MWPTLTLGIMIWSYWNLHYLKMLPHKLQLNFLADIGFWENLWKIPTNFHLYSKSFPLNLNRYLGLHLNKDENSPKYLTRKTGKGKIFWAKMKALSFKFGFNWSSGTARMEKMKCTKGEKFTTATTDNGQILIRKLIWWTKNMD